MDNNVLYVLGYIWVLIYGYGFCHTGSLQYSLLLLSFSFYNSC